MSKKTKIWLIIAASLVLAGCIIFGGVMTMFKWDFMKLSTTKYETNEYKILKNYKNISVVTDTADLAFVSSENRETSVVCYEQKKVKHSITVKGDTLIIEVIDTRKWYEHIGIGFNTPKITVSIPQGEYGALSVKASTGDIRIENGSADTLDLSVSTGDVIARSITCKGDVKIKVTTGDTKLTDIACKNVISSGSTGDISLKNVVAAETLSLERSTGDVKLDRSDAAEIFMKTSTGDVEGSLLTEKIFITKASTGDINVPKTTSGGKCEITTGTGDIKIDID